MGHFPFSPNFWLAVNSGNFLCQMERLYSKLCQKLCSKMFQTYNPIGRSKNLHNDAWRTQEKKKWSIPN